MIKFFRQLRKNSLALGKTSKYFKYAVGEIILVVIGILIALWINNLNIKNQQKEEAISILKSLEKELLENKINLEFRKKEMIKIQKNFIEVLNYSANPNSNLSADSIKAYIKRSFVFGAINIKDSRIISARSSGKFSLLSEDLVASFADYETSISNFKLYLDKISFFDDSWFEMSVKLNATKEIHELFYKDINLINHPSLIEKNDEFKNFIQAPNTYKLLYKYYTEDLVQIGWVDLVLIRIESTLGKIKEFRTLEND